MKKFHEYNMINKAGIKLIINRNEILRYLGYGSGKVDEVTDGIIDDCIDEILKITKTNFLYNIYELGRENGNIFLKNLILKLEGKDIYNHLQNSYKCVIMAVTLGNEVDSRIRYYSKFNLTKSLIFDACATAAVEALCDIVESGIKKIAVDNGYNTTTRYSPGYGDLSIEIQPRILNLLNAQKHIGLTVTDSCILLPRKSVTAFIGIGKDLERKALSCKKCKLYDNCLFTKEGDNCANSKSNKQ